ncbi:hypothetical protein IO679_004698 [Salmonella enterica subsp. enterica serovar Glostrup]|nr:hypothetical protein [Salmonella enterica subsp. enterica serovar Glostrup]
MAFKDNDVAMKERERVQSMLASNLAKTYPDVVKACIDTGVSIETFSAIEASLTEQLLRDSDPFSVLKH